MTTYLNKRQETEALKKILKPHTQNKLTNPKEKVKPAQDTRYLPIRGQG